MAARNEGATANFGIEKAGGVEDEALVCRKSGVIGRERRGSSVKVQLSCAVVCREFDVELSVCSSFLAEIRCRKQ